MQYPPMCHYRIHADAPDQILVIRVLPMSMGSEETFRFGYHLISTQTSRKINDVKKK